MFEDLQIVLLQADRDEDTLKESGLWPNFKADVESAVFMHAYLYVPGKILIGICEKTSGPDVPYVALMKNSWGNLKKTRELCDIAIGRKGAPFREANSQGCGKEVKVKTGTVKGSFSEQPLTAYFVNLASPV